MKYLRVALVVFASALGIARGQSDEDARRTPPVDIPDFSNLDEYIYEPKSTVTLGFRYLSGAKTSFAGQGRILAPEALGPLTGTGELRAYHDGAVSLDTRVTPRLDSSGNAAIDPESGGQIFDPIAPDGKTNSWTYSDNRQRVNIDGNDFMAFHSYSADVIDTETRTKAAQSTAGLEIAVSRDMGKLFGSRAQWVLTAGMSTNDISAKTSANVLATLSTVTDYYSLFGQVPPDAPYTAPSSTAQTLLDASGNAILNSDGSTQTVSVDSTVLIGNQPAGRTVTPTTDSTSVTNSWKVKGAYYTFRAGPTVFIPITNRFRLSFSLGAALVYAGTNYTVTESFAPELGLEISDSNTSATSKLLPGYYADASMQFDLTDRTGFYAGAVFQSAGSYDQKLDSANAHYTTKVDLANQNGLRAGMAIRF